MAQEKIALNSFNEVQPIKFDYNFATTYTEDSGRPQGGKARLTPLFTVESFDVSYENLTTAQVSAILKQIVPSPAKPFFNLHYFSPYNGKWQTKEFYVGEGSLVLKSLKEGSEKIDSISCSFVGRDKIC